MSPSVTTFLFEAANFVALFALLGWLFFKPVREALKTQQTKIVAQTEEAAHKLAEAEKAQEAITMQQQQLVAEGEHLRAQAREDAKREVALIMAAGRAQLERERAALRRDALNIEKAQAAKIARAVATTVYAAVQRFFEQVEGPELEHTLLNAARRELTGFATASLAPITVESAVPLDAEAQHRITSALGAAEDTVEFHVVPELTAGVRIATAQGLIDATVAGLASFAQQALLHEIEAIIRKESEDV